MKVCKYGNNLRALFSFVSIFYLARSFYPFAPIVCLVIFRFVHCLEVNQKMINSDLGGTLEGLLSTRVPQNQPCRVNFRVHLGVHEGP